VKLLAQREREATAALISHLAVLDERRLYLREGCSSMFTYCVQVLHLSEHAAYKRIEVVRAARKYPVILELLGDGSVNLTTVTLLAPHLTPENHVALLAAAKHQRKRQVEELVASLRPLPSVPSSIRRLPTQPSRYISTPSDPIGAQAVANLPPQPPPPSSPARRATVKPLAPQRYKVQFTASAETREKLRLAQDLLRHQIPDGDLGEIMDRALTALLEQLAKQKLAATDRPRTRRDRERKGTLTGTAAGSRHIPAEVRRTVWKRDGGQCAFVGRNGRRCTERAFLEFHHVVPFSAGGEAAAENIQLRCRTHNGYEAELYFGQRAVHSRNKASIPIGNGSLSTRSRTSSGASSVWSPTSSCQ
jgi:5-methylcytosine-specific restriction endonuclease McrA